MLFPYCALLCGILSTVVILVNPHTPHQSKEMALRAPATNYHLKVKYALRFVVSYVQPFTQHYESRTVQKAPLQSK